MNITVNILELASELADQKCKIQYGQNRYEIIEGETFVYTEQAQEMFDRWYDVYYSLIDNLKIK